MTGFSVIIPTLNRTYFLINTLKDLMVQKFEYPFEIIIVDQSTKINNELIHYLKDIEIIKHFHITTFKGLPEARNYGASKALYDFLLYLDDDIRCGTNLLQQHFDYLKKNKVALVAGGITEKFKKNINCEIGKFVFSTATPLRGFHINTKKEIDHAGGGNFSVKKKLYNKIGGIDEHLTKGAALYEETDFCLRLKNLGYIIFYNYGAHVYHMAAETGGCRVPNIRKYIFSLSRNRTIIINRYLSWFHKITANLYLLKLICSYVITYKDIQLYNSYFLGIKEGNKLAKLPTLRTW